MRAVYYSFSAALFAFTIAAVAIAVAGCSAPPVEGSGPDPFSVKKTKKGTVTDTTKNGTEPAGTPSSNGGTTTTPPTQADAGAPSTTTDAGGTTTTGACSGEASKTACFTCCETKNPQGLQFLQQAFGDCACNANAAGNCVAECGSTWCSGLAASATCDNCLNVATACENTADQACATNAACAGLLQCDSASGCAAKP